MTMNELRGPYAHFSTSVFCITWSFPFPGTPYADSDLGYTDKAEIRDDLSFEENWEVASKHATVFHERRHFHDWIGTPLGMVLFDHAQRIVNQYMIHLSPHLRSLDKLTLPLINHWDEPDCPPDVKEFLANYLVNQGNYQWLMADTKLPDDFTSDDWLSEYREPHTGKPIPVVCFPEFRFLWKRELRSYDREYFPVGGLQILECLAFTLEALFVREQFGTDYEMKLNEEVLVGADGWNYGLVHGIAQKILGKLPLEAVLIGCEFALCVPARRSDPYEFHPGWRLMFYLMELSETDDLSVDGAKAAIHRLCIRENWIHPREALQQALTYISAQIKHNDSGPDASRSIVKEYNAIYYKLAQTMLKERIATDFPARNPWLYFQDVSKRRFPTQPFSRFFDGERYHLHGHEEVNARQVTLVTWLFLEDLVHKLVLKGQLTCPMKAGGQMEKTCPFETAECGFGAAYETVESKMCLYGDSLYGLGLIDADDVAPRFGQRFDDMTSALQEYHKREETRVKDKKCDVCGLEISESQMRVISGQTIIQLTISGFVPSRLPFSRPDLPAEQLRNMWCQIVIMNAGSHWGVCPICVQEIEKSEP